MATSNRFYQLETLKNSSLSGLKCSPSMRHTEQKLQEAKGNPVLSKKYSHLGWGILQNFDIRNFEGHFEYQSNYRTEPIIDDISNIVFGGRIKGDLLGMSAVIKLNGEHMCARIVEGKVTDRGIALVELPKTDPTWLAPPYRSASNETINWTDRVFRYRPTRSFSMQSQEVSLQSFRFKSGHFSYTDLADEFSETRITVYPTNFHRVS